MRGQSQRGVGHVTGGRPGSYIIEVLASFHYVWSPFHLINLHPPLSQELSGRGSTDTHGEFKGQNDLLLTQKMCVW